jgi:hypothetical protein
VRRALFSSSKSISEVLMFSKLSRFAALLPLTALTVSACDSQVGDDYPGEALATLEGTISVADSIEVPSEAVATVVWHVWQDGDGASRTAPVAIDGEFPASFTLGIYEAPPLETQFDLGAEEESLAGIHLATGYVTVMPPGEISGGLSEVFETALGVETQHILVWSDGDVPAGFLRFTDAIEPGYQLFRAVEAPGSAEARACLEEVAQCFDACAAEHCPNEECTPEYDGCIAACPDISLCPEYDPKVSLERVLLDTSLSIVLGGDKQTPNWY